MLEQLAQIHSNLSYKASMTHRGAAGRTRNPPAQVAALQQQAAQAAALQQQQQAQSLPAMPQPNAPTLGPAGSLDTHALAQSAQGQGQNMLPQMGDFPLGPFPQMPPLSASGSNNSASGERDSGLAVPPASKKRKPSPLATGMSATGGQQQGQGTSPRSASLGRAGSASNNNNAFARASVSPRMATRSAGSPPVSSGSTGSRTKKTYSSTTGTPTLSSHNNGLANMLATGHAGTLPGMSVPNSATTAPPSSYYQPYQTQGVHGYSYKPHYYHQHKLLSVRQHNGGSSALSPSPLNASLSSSSSSSSSAACSALTTTTIGNNTADLGLTPADLSNLSQYYSQPSASLSGYQPFAANPGNNSNSGSGGFPHQQQQRMPNSAAAAAAAAAAGINYADLPVMPTSEGRHIPNLDALISVMQNEDYAGASASAGGGGSGSKQGQQAAGGQRPQQLQHGAVQAESSGGARSQQQQQHGYQTAFPPFDFSAALSNSSNGNGNGQVGANATSSSTSKPKPYWLAPKRTNLLDDDERTRNLHQATLPSSPSCSLSQAALDPLSKNRQQTRPSPSWACPEQETVLQAQDASSSRLTRQPRERERAHSLPAAWIAVDRWAQDVSLAAATAAAEAVCEGELSDYMHKAHSGINDETSSDEQYGRTGIKRGRTGSKRERTHSAESLPNLRRSRRIGGETLTEDLYHYHHQLSHHFYVLESLALLLLQHPPPDVNVLPSPTAALHNAPCDDDPMSKLAAGIAPELPIAVPKMELTPPDLSCPLPSHISVSGSEAALQQEQQQQHGSSFSFSTTSAQQRHSPCSSNSLLYPYNTSPRSMRLATPSADRDLPWSLWHQAAQSYAANVDSAGQASGAVSPPLFSSGRTMSSERSTSQVPTLLSATDDEVEEEAEVDDLLVVERTFVPAPALASSSLAAASGPASGSSARTKQEDDDDDDDDVRESTEGLLSLAGMHMVASVHTLR